MIKKEISEIRKTLRASSCGIHTINLCYVGPEKETIFFSRHPFLSLPENDVERYCDIFKKTMAGKPEKNLVTLIFNNENGDERQEVLMKVWKEKGGKGKAAEAFCAEIAEKCDIVGNFLIILAFGAYDVPVRTSDGMTQWDESDNVYDFMLCSICPVEPSERGLFYRHTPLSVQHAEAEGAAPGHRRRDTGLYSPAGSRRAEGSFQERRVGRPRERRDDRQYNHRKQGYFRV